MICCDIKPLEEDIHFNVRCESDNFVIFSFLRRMDGLSKAVRQGGSLLDRLIADSLQASHLGKSFKLKQTKNFQINHISFSVSPCRKSLCPYDSCLMLTLHFQYWPGIRVACVGQAGQGLALTGKILWDVAHGSSHWFQGLITHMGTLDGWLHSPLYDYGPRPEIITHAARQVLFTSSNFFLSRSSGSPNSVYDVGAL